MVTSKEEINRRARAIEKLRRMKPEERTRFYVVFNTLHPSKYSHDARVNHDKQRRVLMIEMLDKIDEA